MAVAGFNTFLEQMAAMDFFTGVLPLVLTYVVLYAGLKQVPVLNNSDNNFPPVIALIGALFTARFIVVNPTYQSFFVDFWAKLVVGLMGFIGLLVLLAFTGYKMDENSALKTPLTVMIMIGIIVSAFVTAGGLGFRPELLQLANIMPMVNWMLESGMIWILAVVGALWWVSQDGSDKKTQDYMAPFFSNKWWKGMMDDDEG